ncbi:Aminopeptidase [Entamoeba marina]
MSDLLPTSFSPSHYIISISPFPSDNNFFATTTIHLTYKEREQISLSIPNGFDIGEYELELTYFGNLLTDDLSGFYQSKYTFNNTTHTICCTQFAASAARKAFPCFDEPSYKATFDIILHVSKYLDCFSNMPIKHVEEQSNDKIVTFQTTPKMSTYIVAFVIGEFTSQTTQTKNGVKLGLHFPKNHTNISNFILKTMEDCLDLYENAYNIKYPLPKCDWIAIPDFGFGAMENWGIITSRESIFTYPQFITSINQTNSINVTMKWWNDLWLNEGFASYMGDLFAVATLFPEWELNVLNVVDSVFPVLEKDGCEQTHPISVPVKKASDIDQLFDMISYDKGSALISMIINYVGFEDFMTGVNSYLRKYSYGNATSDQLWECIGDVCKIDLNSVVKEWTYTSGYPIITVTYEGNQLHFAQERCGCNSDQLWKVPMILTGKNDVVSYFNYVIANTNTTGFYRVNYSDELLNNINPEELNQQELMNVLNDLYSMCSLGKRSLKQYFSFINKLHPFTTETYLVARVVVGHLEDVLITFKKITQRLLSPALSELGITYIPKEPNNATKLRALCMTSIETHELINYSLKIINENMLNDVSIELQQTICTIAAKNATMPIIEALINLCKTSENPEIKRIALMSLGCVKSDKFVKFVLDFALDHVRLQDFPLLVCVMLKGESDVVRLWIEDHLDYINKKFGIGMATLRSRMFVSLIERNSSFEMYDYYLKFFNDHVIVGSENSINQALEKLLKRANWVQRDLEQIVQFIQSK